MSAEGSSKVSTSSAGGAAVTHPATTPMPILVGPSTGDEFNRVSLRLIPVACWGIEDVRFAFDSSFVGSDPGATDEPDDIRAEFTHLTSLIDSHPNAPMSIFGHADPVGDDTYNKALSGRRATSIYALLLFNTDPTTSLSLWKKIAVTEKWDSRHKQAMLDLTQLPASTDASTLMQTYMQTLCKTAPKLTKSDFLAQGADPHGKGDYQGCSEFNPRVLFSAEKEEQFKQGKADNDATVIADRNVQNAPNRRVMVLLFRKGSKVDPAKWPCPAATDDQTGCIKRFWKDGDTRRSTHLPGIDRSFDDTHDTFACRFYQRISQNSPCEVKRATLVIWLLDDYGQRVAVGTPYRIHLGGETRKGTLATAGLIVEKNVVLSRTAEIEWGTVDPQDGREEDEDQYLRAFVMKKVPNHPFITGTTPITPPDDILLYRTRLSLDSDHNDVDSDDVVTIRLGNLGYHRQPDIPFKIGRFQTDYEDTSDADEARKQKLRDVHRDGTEMPLKTPDPVELGPVPVDENGEPIKQCSNNGTDLDDDSEDDDDDAGEDSSDQNSSSEGM